MYQLCSNKANHRQNLSINLLNQIDSNYRPLQIVIKNAPLSVGSERVMSSDREGSEF